MINGTVSARHASVSVPFLHPNASVFEIEFVLDTGFAGFLTLPPTAITALSLPFLYRIPATLADGSRITVDVYEAEIRWDGSEISVEVLATGGEALLGTSLLDGYEVCITFSEGGAVVIKAS